MAEYIDIDKIEYRKGVLLGSEENPLPIIHKVATIEVIRDWTPKADVVERSKIDKAIAQLEEEKEFAYANFGEYNEEVLGYDDTDVCERDLCYIGLTRAIEILKRNLGCEEDA